MSLVHGQNFFRRLEEGNMAACTETAERSEDNLELKEIRHVYLITYSRADTRKVPSRQRFAEIVLEAFESRGASVIQWACCKERHTTGGVHPYGNKTVQATEMVVKSTIHADSIWNKRSFFQSPCQLLYCVAVHYKRG